MSDYVRRYLQVIKDISLCRILIYSRIYILYPKKDVNSLTNKIKIERKRKRKEFQLKKSRGFKITI